MVARPSSGRPRWKPWTRSHPYVPSASSWAWLVELTGREVDRDRGRRRAERGCPVTSYFTGRFEELAAEVFDEAVLFCEWDERVRIEHAVLGVVPPGEGFDHGDATRLQLID